MHQRDRSEAAARRLALIAADLGVAPAPAAAADDTAGAGEGTTAGGDPWWADHTRVAASRDPGPSETSGSGQPPPPPVPPLTLPVPGRHAARRRTALAPLAWTRRVPVLTPAHLAVVALAVALGLAVTTWWVVRDDPAPAAMPVAGEPVSPLVLGTQPATPGADPAGTAQDAGGTVTVDVAGKVRRPGIVVLDTGSRVADALAAAGGARKGVDLTSLNLARVLVDGEQVVVGMPGAAPSAAPGASDGTGGVGADGPLVNLNLASQAELEALPQIGPVTAQSIITWRDQRGGFTSVDELLEIDGIGEKTLAKLKTYVTV